MDVVGTNEGSNLNNFSVTRIYEKWYKNKIKIQLYRLVCILMH